MTTKIDVKSLTPSKAGEILHHGEVHGHPLTPRQRRFFGWVRGKKGKTHSRILYPFFAEEEFYVWDKHTAHDASINQPEFYADNAPLVCAENIVPFSEEWHRIYAPYLVFWNCDISGAWTRKQHDVNLKFISWVTRN
jgi:hypothetical protein